MGGSQLFPEQPNLELHLHVSIFESRHLHHECELTMMCRCINSRSRRFSNITDIFAHQYFAEVEWDVLRQTRAPFVPELDSETDAGYFDDFTNEADMAKYKEVHDKQQALETMAEREDQMSKSLFVGFTFRHRKPATEDGGSPRKRIPTDESFGTMF
jgi:cell cycle protein kinase DBF2